MKSHRRTLLFLLVALSLTRPSLAGEAFLLDRESTVAAAGSTLSAICPSGRAEGRLLCLLDEGRVQLCQWQPPVLEVLESLWAEVSQVIPIPIAPPDRWLLLLGQSAQDYELWRETEGNWSRVARGSFGGRVALAAGGHFAAGEGAGLFAQFESGQIGYWQAGPDGCLPVWQSPDPRPRMVRARATDLDGDSQDELLAVDVSGAVTVWRWYNGLWENARTLPAWGQVLGLDVAQADGHPGLEAAIVTSQRGLFLFGATGGAFAVRARLATAIVAAHVGLVPQGNGAVVLGDAGGDLYLYLPEGNSWRLEAHVSGEERISFLTGLGPERILVGTVAGNLRVFRLVPLDRLTVFLDGEEIKSTGLYWEDGEFYFGLAFLEHPLGISAQWEAKRSRLALTRGKTSVVAEANKTEALVNGRPWPLSRPILLAGKVPFVPAELLGAVFRINVTHDPGSDWLILTTSPEM